MNDKELMQAQIKARRERLSEMRWRTFEGEDALNLLRKVARMKGSAPVLVVHCERKPGWGAHEYEYFVPTSVSVNCVSRIVDLHGTLGPNGPRQTLHWSPDKAHDDSGKYVSFISTLPEHFPLELEEIVVEALIFLPQEETQEGKIEE